MNANTQTPIQNDEVCYDFEYAICRLRDAIDYAEIEGDFQSARRWVNEVEKAASQLRTSGEEHEC